jgi:hypothetical protein
LVCSDLVIYGESIPTHVIANFACRTSVRSKSWRERACDAGQISASADGRAQAEVLACALLRKQRRRLVLLDRVRRVQVERSQR